MVNNMVQEQLITFETAKLANEKGFNSMKSNCYGDNMCYKLPEEKLINSLNGGNNYILAPTQSLLQQWLRDKHKIYVEITADHYSTGINWNYQVFRSISGYPYCEGGGSFGNNGEYETYEIALEEGLLEALTHINNMENTIGIISNDRIGKIAFELVDNKTIKQPKTIQEITNMEKSFTIKNFRIPLVTYKETRRERRVRERKQIK